ncbi:rod shape-determining protein MreC [Aquincola sp. MAHUQ-54]|uniref:Cell shape-determining protein MreC n=1 Tax=Aquincola agrisoli TaxID=3119538 RepID=A0AAW9Q5C2_9BURK
MQLGTLDRTPPPFFRQGVSALTKLLFFSALAVFLMVADNRFQLVVAARAVLATALAPVERALLVPREMIHGGRDYLEGLGQARAAEDAARQQLLRQAERVAQVDLLARENDRLRALLELRPPLQVRSIAAEVLYEAADPFSRKLFIDRGERHGVMLASPVINEAGVMGQVTRVYPLTAEVTLLTDKDAAIPVLNTRTQQRSAAFGGAGQGTAMELRFMAANSDVRAGDVLTTSGVDGIYPSGLPVATVMQVERQADAGFARIALKPSAPLDGVRHVLVLEPLNAQLPPPPAPEPAAAVDPRSKRKP